MKPLRLPSALQRHLDATVADYVGSTDSQVDFTTPAGEPGLAGPDSVSWRVNIEKAADFDVHLDFSCDDAAAGNHRRD